MMKIVKVKVSKRSNDAVEFGRIVQGGADQVEGWDLFHCTLGSQEVESITLDLPGDALLCACLLLRLDESHQLVTRVNHEELLHISETERLIAAFG